MILLLAVVAVVSACGSGGGDDVSPQTAAPPTSDPPPTVVMPACVQTVLGCYLPERYEAERQTIEDAHANEDAFKNQWGLEAIRAERAYAQLELEHGIGLEPGSGQTVGLIDTGIDEVHPVFAGKTVTEQFFGTAEDDTGDGFSHGTAVASVISARRGAELANSGANAAHGVAWGADIAMFAIPTGSGGGTYHPLTLTGQTSYDELWASRLTQILNWSSGGRTLDFVNVSVGYHGIIDQYSEEELRRNFLDSIAVVAQAGKTDMTVFVWSAGNAHSDPCDDSDFTDNPDLCVRGRVNAKSVEILAGLPARIPELRGNLIAVVAVAPDGDGDGDHEIAEFSNRCGIAKDWCIAAPGVDVWVAYFGPHPDDDTPGLRLGAVADGTSFAAPMVTGALVVMKDYFRAELLNTDLVARLLATADKSGIYADADVYGQGLLDLAAATSPVGSPRIAIDQRVEGAAVDLTATGLGLGDALGDGLAQALAGQEIAAFDDLGAPFWYALDSFTDTADGPAARTRLRGFMAQPRVRVGDPVVASLARCGCRVSMVTGSDASRNRDSAMLDASLAGRGNAGHLSLAGRALTLSTAGQGSLSAAAFSTEGLDGQAPASGATLDWWPEGAPLGVHGGWVGEREALLGSRAAGAFGRMTADSAFAGIEARARIGAWRLGAGAEVGTVSTSVRGGLIADVSPLITSAFALQAVRPLNAGDTFTLSLSQPLRVEAGHASLSVPVGRTKDGLVRRRPVTADLVPTGRQIEVTAQWRWMLSTGGELRLGARLDPSSWTRSRGGARSHPPRRLAPYLLTPIRAARIGAGRASASPFETSGRFEQLQPRALNCGPAMSAPT